jgi:hypothetical protein
MRIIDSTTSRPFDKTTSSRSEFALQREAWFLLGWLGIAFVVLGFADIALGLYPLAFGNQEWEFGTVSAILNGFALPTMGFYLLLGSLVSRGKGIGARVLALVMIVVAVLLVVLGLLYATAIPLALKSVSGNAVVALGMKKALVKAAVLLVGYLALYLFGAFRGCRSPRVN